MFRENVLIPSSGFKTDTASFYSTTQLHNDEASFLQIFSKFYMLGLSNMFVCVKRACKRWNKKQNTWHRCYNSNGGTALSPSFNVIFQNIKIMFRQARQGLTPNPTGLLKTLSLVTHGGRVISVLNHSLQGNFRKYLPCVT